MTNRPRSRGALIATAVVTTLILGAPGLPSASAAPSEDESSPPTMPQVGGVPTTATTAPAQPSDEGRTTFIPPNGTTETASAASPTTTGRPAPAVPAATADPAPNSGPAQAVVGTAPATGCPSVYVVAAHSKWGVPNAAPGTGDNIDSIIKMIEGNVSAGTVEVFTVPAPANPSADYESAKADGVNAINRAIVDVANQCSATKFAFVGEQQGAGTVGDAAQAIGLHRGPQRADESRIGPENVVAVALLSDPERNALPGKRDTVSPISAQTGGTGTASRTSPATDGGSTSPTTTGRAAPQANRARAANAQLVGPQVPGQGIAGSRPEGFGALSKRTGTLCLEGDINCAATSSNNLVSSLVSVATGDGSAVPEATRQGLTAASALAQVFMSSVTPADITSIAGQAGVAGASLAAASANPAAALPAVPVAANLAGDSLQILSRLVSAYESNPDLPQIAHVINLIDPDAADGQKVIAALGGEKADPVVLDGLRSAAKLLRALNSVDRAQVLQFGAKVAHTIANPNPAAIAELVREGIVLLGGVITVMTQVDFVSAGRALSNLNPNPLNAAAPSTELLKKPDYAATPINRDGMSAVEWVAGWMVQQVGKVQAV